MEFSLFGWTIMVVRTKNILDLSNQTVEEITKRLTEAKPTADATAYQGA